MIFKVSTISELKIYTKWNYKYEIILVKIDFNDTEGILAAVEYFPKKLCNLLQAFIYSDWENL